MGEAGRLCRPDVPLHLLLRERRVNRLLCQHLRVMLHEVHLILEGLAIGIPDLYDIVRLLGTNG